MFQKYLKADYPGILIYSVLDAFDDSPTLGLKLY